MLTPDLTPIQLVTQYSFITAFFGMVAGAVFFTLERREAPEPFRGALSVSAIICMIAAMNYFYMKDVYVMGVATGVNKFPTEFRYIDWILTVPLMLVKFPVLLGMGPKGRQFLIILVTLALLMIVSGFIGEVNPENLGVHLGLFAVGTIAWLLIVGLLFFSLGDLPETVAESTRKTIRRMGMFVFVGWIIYPVGYLMPSFGTPGVYRDIIYNVGDVINKVGLGMLVYIAAGMRRKEELLEQVAYEAQHSYEQSEA